jgi:membrane protein DedA with SNARE-associated domain
VPDFILPFVSSPWIYAIVFAVCAIDAFFPPVPCGVVVVTLAAFSVTGDPSLAGLLAVAAAGAFVGDTIAYLLGRYLTGWVSVRWVSVGKVPATAARVHDALTNWGGGMLVVARFVPGGRTVATVSAGSMRYPIRRFWLFTAVAALAWGSWTTAIGYAGGQVFHSPVPGAVGGVALASALGLIIEAVRRLARRCNRRTDLPQHS